MIKPACRIYDLNLITTKVANDVWCNDSVASRFQLVSKVGNSCGGKIRMQKLSVGKNVNN